MGVLRLSEAGIVNYEKYSNFLAGNEPFGVASDDFLEEVILTSSASSVTFSGLGAYTDYKHLQIRMVVRDTRTSATGGDAMNVRFNSDSTTSYSSHFLRGNGSAVSSGSSTSQTSAAMVRISTNTQTTGNFGAGVMDVLDFSDTSKNTTMRCLSGFDGNLELRSGLFAKTNAITSIELIAGTGNLVTGSRFSLYGSKG